MKIRYNVRNAFLDAAKVVLGSKPGDQITRQEILKVCENKGIVFPQWLVNDEEFYVARGVYRLPEYFQSSNQKNMENETAADLAPAMAAGAANVVNLPSSKDHEEFVPKKAKGYVPFGYFSDVQKIIESRQFYPAYITGLSGNGKTFMVEQAAAVTDREMIRVNITIETDEDDLIGGFRLVEGQTEWQDGPVVVAMKRGAILLLDEVDLGSNKLMCLQPILEGNGIFIKKIKQYVAPKPGFTIFATANTKGKGSDDGRFIGTNVMNEAFLERFSITMEQEYPAAKTEEKILNNILVDAGKENPKFVSQLVAWAQIVRKTFLDGAVNEVISTRRLVHIIQAFKIWGDEKKALQLCLNRFDEDTKVSFMELYSKLSSEEDSGEKTKAKSGKDSPEYRQTVKF